MRRKLFFYLMILSVMLISLPGAGHSWSVITIEKPEHQQKFYADLVEIIIRFEGDGKPTKFSVWLNHKNITHKFESIANGMRAVVGPYDGLSIYEESLETTRDDKGVWFIKGSGKSSYDHAKGKNLLRTMVRSKNRRLLIDSKDFFVDMRVYNAFEAMGYAVATDRLWQAELYRRQARGRLAEIFGPSELPTDTFMRTIGYSDEELQEGFEALDGEVRAIVSGYVAGFNRRIADIRNDITLLPFEFAALEIMPQDWEVEDALAWIAMLQRLFDPEALRQTQIDNAALFQTLVTKFLGEGRAMFEDLRWLNDPDALTYIPDKRKGPSDYRKTKKQSFSMEIKTFPINIGKAAESMAEIRKKVVENLKKKNAHVKMGSYAWAVAGSKTASGNPIIYSGPQMGFSVPSIVLEGSLNAAGFNISGMTVAGIPGIIIGRTPHHAWSMQVGNAHTTDYYVENPANVKLHRTETIRVAGMADVSLPVWRTDHGPVINPMPYIPGTSDPTNPIISWKYSHWGYEFDAVKGFTDMARARNMDEFGAGIELMAVSQHYCYADRHGNIAYWMSGRDPVRPEGEWRLPQGQLGPPLEWDSAVLIDRVTDRNTRQGFYGGWNNKSNAEYDSATNSLGKYFGPFNRAHVVDDYLRHNDHLTFKDLRNLAMNIATTNSWEGGGNPWKFVARDFAAAVYSAGLTRQRRAALKLLKHWDGHWVAGGLSQWPLGADVADAWILMDAWIREVISLTFDDELATSPQPNRILFNVLLRGLGGYSSGIVNKYNWFQNREDPGAPQTADMIIVQALDTVLSMLGDRPWGVGARGLIYYEHAMLGEVHATPHSQRSTYAHCVEMGPSGPVRIESMFPLGESGNILMGDGGVPVFDPNFFSMTPVYDDFSHRPFPLFE